MSGVTHFERRDLRGRKKEHPTCPFCLKTFRTTPMTISRAGGPAKYIEEFNCHLAVEVGVNSALVLRALEAASKFSVSVYDNC